MSFSFSRHTAIFGGSFDPPHMGHVEAIEGLKKNPGVARVVVVPSFGTPLKTVKTSFDIRSQMASIAFADHAELDQIEGKSQTQFTWELLQIMKEKHPTLAFVVGTDQFESFHNWARFPEVLRMSDWIVLLRKPKTLLQLKASIERFVNDRILLPTTDAFEFLISGSDHVLRIVETEAPAISSTELRENFSLGKKNENLNFIPKPVFEYIERNKLYGT